ncbi:hypothetical protein ACFRFU_48945 [Streptomyces sp. NPDC056704]|uniref:hypothetical protein n=1 Tax=Streptomyces sp. NPDC056704 TaxID=3345917 RepID=UPI003698C44B
MSTPSSWLSHRSSARQQDSLAKARQELTELSVTMRSKDRAVDMTVGPQGEPTTWRFLNSGHRAMSGQAPAVGVPEARATARHVVTLRETTRFEELTGTGLGLTRSGLKDLQLDRPLEPLSGADLPSWMRAEDKNPGGSPSAGAEMGRRPAGSSSARRTPGMDRADRLVFDSGVAFARALEDSVGTIRADGGRRV